MRTYIRRRETAGPRPITTSAPRRDAELRAASMLVTGDGDDDCHPAMVLSYSALSGVSRSSSGITLPLVTIAM